MLNDFLPNDTQELCTEDKLKEIWQEIFGVVEIKSDSDFFELGGNSLTAIKLISQVEREFGPETLLPEVLFMDGRLKTLADAIDAERKKKLL
jgi:acyl carrier protein